MRRGWGGGDIDCVLADGPHFSFAVRLIIQVFNDLSVKPTHHFVQFQETEPACHLKIRRHPVSENTDMTEPEWGPNNH